MAATFAIRGGLCPPVAGKPVRAAQRWSASAHDEGPGEPGRLRASRRRSAALRLGGFPSSPGAGEVATAGAGLFDYDHRARLDAQFAAQPTYAWADQARIGAPTAALTIACPPFWRFLPASARGPCVIYMHGLTRSKEDAEARQGRLRAKASVCSRSTRPTTAPALPTGRAPTHRPGPARHGGDASSDDDRPATRSGPSCELAGVLIRIASGSSGSVSGRRPGRCCKARTTASTARCCFRAERAGRPSCPGLSPSTFRRTPKRLR